MLKREKEVFELLLEQEDGVLKDLETQYKRAIADIDKKIRLLQSDELTQSRIYQINYQKALKGQIEAILEKLHGDEYSSIQDYLSKSYTNTFVGTMYAMSGQGIPIITPIDQAAAVRAVVTDSKLSTNLYDALGLDIGKLKKRIQQEITRGIATSLSYSQMARNLTQMTSLPLSNAMRIVRTEGHRIQQTSADDARKIAKSKGADVLKQWDASLDMVTRPLHRQLDGQIRETDEPFEAGGYKVMYPGTFGVPSQDCNCRCVALTRARWALDEKELETLKERAKYFELDKTKDFEDYKNKYLKAAETLKNQGKSSIIKTQGNLSIPVAKFTQYALNPAKDPNKATAFKLALGYDMTNADDLIENIFKHVDESKFVPNSKTPYGLRYEYVMRLTGPNGKQANVLTGWIEESKDIPKRLTTVHVTDKKVTDHED